MPGPRLSTASRGCVKRPSDVRTWTLASICSPVAPSIICPRKMPIENSGWWYVVDLRVIFLVSGDTPDGYVTRQDRPNFRIDVRRISSPSSNSHTNGVNCLRENCDAAVVCREMRTWLSLFPACPPNRRRPWQRSENRRIQWRRPRQDHIPRRTPHRLDSTRSSRQTAKSRRSRRRRCHRSPHWRFQG